MGHVRRPGMTPQEFLAWEERQELRYEFDGSQPNAMVGATWAHALIQGNVQTALTNRLRGSTCRASGSGMKVPIPTGQYRYPDAFVTCTPLEAQARLAPEPVVIFEILSESTARTDRTDKLREYISIPTVHRYVMLEQDAATITVITRSETGWSLAVLRDGESLAMPEIGIEIPVGEFYVDVEFPPPPE